MYEPGVDTVGFKPRSARCEAVRGMSATSSLERNSGRSVTEPFTASTARRSHTRYFGLM